MVNYFFCIGELIRNAQPTETKMIYILYTYLPFVKEICPHLYHSSYICYTYFDKIAKYIFLNKSYLYSTNIM